MIRNQSKPALQLPEIHNSSIGKQNEVLSRNDIQGQILQSNRSKKSLYTGLVWVFTIRTTSNCKQPMEHQALQTKNTIAIWISMYESVITNWTTLIKS